jgi:hypothetical protein
VVLYDPLPLAAVVEWEEALSDCRGRPCGAAIKIISRMFGAADAEAREAISEEYAAHYSDCSESDNRPRCTLPLSDTATQARMVTAVRPCVQEWHIDGFDLANPPGSPKMSRSKFVAWLIKEITDLYVAEDPVGDPNA